MSDTDSVKRFRKKVRRAHEKTDKVFQDLWLELYEELQKTSDRFTKEELLVLFASVQKQTRATHAEIIKLMKTPKIRRVK